MDMMCSAVCSISLGCVFDTGSLPLGTTL